MFKKLLSLSVLSMLTISLFTQSVNAEWNHISRLSKTKSRSTITSVDSNKQKTKVTYETQVNRNNYNNNYSNRNNNYRNNNSGSDIVKIHLMLTNLASRTGGSYYYSRTNVNYL